MNQGILKEFRDFITTGNIIEIAVAFIMAAAFVPVVGALVDGILMPIIAAVVGEPNFDNIGFDLGDARVAIGIFITAIVKFLLIAAAVFFFIVKPVQMIKDRQKSGAEAPPPPPEDIQLLREIRDSLRR